MRWSDLVGKRLLIVGTGREGIALAERLTAQGARVMAVEDRESAATAAWRVRWGEGVPVLVAPAADRIRDWDAAIVSPGVPPHAPIRRLLAELGIPETTATALWLEEHAEHTIGVTGSKGKSTTASLVNALARAHDLDAQLGGNIGIPLLGLPPAELYAAELSSYQSSSVTRSPRVAVITSLFPEHLDWHGSEDAYYAAKFELARHGAATVIVNGEDPRLADALARLAPEIDVERVGLGQRWSLDEHEGETWITRDGAPMVPCSMLKLPGRHNALNAALALAALEAWGVAIDPARASHALAVFRPLAHRLEPVRDGSGLTFVDDSLSTSPYAAVAALEALDRDDVVLLVGGQDRGVPSDPLLERLRNRPIAGLVGLPDSGARLLADLASSGVPAHLAEDMDDAIHHARRLAPVGGAVLLSPAAPSYGRYRDFADRAADFRRAISASAPES